MKNLMLRMSKSGHSQSAIARYIGITPSCVCKSLKRIKEEGTCLPASKSGRPRVTTVTQDRYLLYIYKKNKGLSIGEISQQWGVNVCRKTIKRRLQEKGLICRKKISKPFLTSSQKKKRLEFCKKYLMWTVADWKKVIFSDECNIQDKPDGGLQHVWRQKSEKYADFAIRKKFKHPTSVMIWGCIANSGKSELHNINGHMNASMPWRPNSNLL
jgi:transposase